MQQALTGLHGGVGRLYGVLAEEPTSGSPAADELRGFAHKQLLGTARSAASLLIETAGEQLTLFVKSVSPPAQPIACCGTVRSLLESCALASWMIDPDIDRTERVGRVLAYGKEGLCQQLAYAQASAASQASINLLKDRIRQLNTRGSQLRSSSAKGRNKGHRNGPVKMPDATRAVAAILDEEVAYRILSAVVHGHSWAIQEVGFDERAVPSGHLASSRIFPVRMQKAVKVEALAWLGLTAARALCRPIWYVFNYEGWDTAALQQVFEDSFDRLHAVESIRFWR
ncbi:MAG: hypothetical protein OXJ55_04885 [Caldilineaceae bacterium]|nr:hypothetical protein [Caldilineaceae bacterium]